MDAPIVKFKSTEFISFILLFGSLSVLVEVLFGFRGAPLWLRVFLELLILGMAIDLAELITAVVFDTCDLPRLSSLETQPSAAILLLVCDDVVPAALACLDSQTYQRADVFILDDSISATSRDALDVSGFRIVRRPGRKGYKAGNINNWLRLYGSGYDYFIVLDSDSILPENFVESILEYAEHPANARVAIFNSLSKCWNTNSRFPRVLAAATPLRNWIRIRLANRSASVLSTGHNSLHRTKALMEIAGFDEDFVAEDIAVTLKLVRSGYTSRLVNLVGYDSEPENIFSYGRRLERWARQTFQIQRADWQDIPLSIRFEMFKLTWVYLAFFLYPTWAVLAAWGAKSSLTDIRVAIDTIGHREIATVNGLLPLVLITLLPVIVPLSKVPLLIRLKVPPRDYLGNCLLSCAIGFYMMLTVCLSQIGAAATSFIEFDVTEKRHRPVTLSAILLHQPSLTLFWIFLIIGFWSNPMAVFFSALWILILFSAPLLIFLFHDRAT